jgi:lipopolysaccharide export system protein LptA
MACKFHAAMTALPRPHPLLPAARSTLAGLLLCSMLVPALAEKADRYQKMEVESDQSGKVDLQNQVVTFSGNVVITKGTLVIRAARVEVRQTPDGYQYATAFGGPALATFRQKRDGVNEFIEGEAERLEYDGRADTVRFVNKAQGRRTRGGAVVDEVTGALITWDNTAELFTVAAAPGAPATSTTPAVAGGRARAVFSAPQGSPAAAEAASASASGARR